MEFMAAAIAIALLLFELEFAVVSLTVSLVGKDAGMAIGSPRELTIVKSPVASVFGTAPAATLSRTLLVVVGEPTGVPALPFKIGKPFHSCVSEIRTISAFSC